VRGGPPHARELLRVCGLAAVQAVFDRDPGRVERLFFEARLKPAVGPFCRALGQAHKPFREVDAAELARVAGTVLHGGIVAITRPRPLAPFDPVTARRWAQQRKPLVILDGVGNPHNLGAIARSAAFFGVAALLLADRPDQALPSDASYRVAEGGLEHLTLYRVRLPAALRPLKRDYRVLGTDAVRGDPPPPIGDRPAALILGSEEHGLAPATLAACDAVIRIPGSGRVQSLNVAAAAAILLYLLARP
jgi:TrmH RNA methyltransferase